MTSLTEPEGVARNMLIVSTTLTGLTVLEYAWNISFEMRVIWPKVWKSAEANIFVIARYVGLAGQIFNVWFVNRMASGIKSHPLACRAWYSHQAVTIQCLLMSVELLLMLRVCKMYKNDKYVLGTLFLFAVGQCAAMVISARMTVPSVSFYPTCMMVSSHPGRIYVGTSIIAVHLCFLAMILWRYLRQDWPEPLRSYLKITVRDSVLIVISVTGILLPVTLAPMGIESQTINNLLFHAMLFCFWFAADRLVLDKERFRLKVQNDRELTEVDLDDLEPFDDPGICLVKPSDSKVVPTEVFIAFDSESGLETEEDITDETHPSG